MKYQSYSVEDFVQDKYFRKWILDPDSETQLFWDTWLAAHPEQADKISQARELIISLPEIRHVYQKDEKQLWNKIVQQINSENSRKSRGKVIALPTTTPFSDIPFKRKKHVGFYISTARLAASLLIIASFCAGYWWINTKSDLPAKSNTWIVKENPYGQRSTIYLSDGTEVILNAGSKVKYPRLFAKDNRRVLLQGEAFFRVAEDTTRPFTVVANNVITQAVGTSFNVRAFPGEMLQVSLVTGKVRVNHTKGNNNIFLLPGECATYDTLRSTLTKGTFDGRLILAWKDGIIHFDNADQETVFEALEKWYGVKIITVNTAPKAWKYTGQLKNMSLDQFLEALQFSMEFKYRIQDKQVIIEYL